MVINVKNPFGIGPLIILAVFLFAVVLLLLNYYRTKKTIKIFLKEKDSNGRLHGLWEEYKATFISILGKTRVRSEEIFYVERVFPNFMSIKYLRSIPCLIF